jgi:threonine/homoserine/homoserine lactone efflux protein
MLLKAFAVGLVLAMPVGPMALLSIQRTLRFGFLTGLVTGVGIALADAVYGLVGVLGLSVVAEWLLQYETVLRLGGGLFLGFLGGRIIHESYHTQKTGTMPEHKGYWTALVSAFFLTLSNPMTILAYIAVMASMNVSAEAFKHPWVFAGPVFLGSFAWWNLINALAYLFKSKLRDEHMHKVGFVSGALLIVFALFVIISAL